MSIIDRSIFLFLILTFFIPFSVFGQTDFQEVDSSHLIANVNLSDARIIAQDSERLNLAFILTNLGDTPQSDIRYGVELIKTLENGGQAIVDSFVSPLTHNLSVGGKLNIPLDIPLVGVPVGTYDVWIKALTTGGVMLGLGNAGAVTVVESQSLEINPTTCSLSITGVEGVFTLRQGVDIAAGEELILTCLVKNHAVTERTVTPKFETHRRTIFGELVPVNNLNAEQLTFLAGEAREISLSLPIATKPQAYDTILSFVDLITNEVVSNRLVSHYVLQGVSATIQNINFSQSDYQAGEYIVMELFWTPAADGFVGSRQGEGSEIGEVIATVQISDQSGNLCSSPINHVLTENPVTLSVYADTDCLLPTATVSFANSDGVILDKRTVVAPEKIKTEVSEVVAVSVVPRLTFMITVTALSLILILLLLVRRSKVAVTKATKLLVLTTVMSAGLFVGAVDVEAVTWISGPLGQTTFTANVDKTLYSPGEQIRVSVSISELLCNNPPQYTASMHLNFEGADRYFNVAFGEGNTFLVHDRTFNFTAPDEPGTYRINITSRWNMNGVSSARTAHIDITVVSSNPPTPSGSIFASPNLCEIPLGGSQCTSNISWSTNNATDVSVRVYGNPNTFSSGVSGSQLAPWIQLNPDGTQRNYLFNLHHNNGAVPVLSSVTVRAQCIAGSSWNGSVCAANPAPTPRLLVCPGAVTMPVGITANLEARYWANSASPSCATDGHTTVTNFSSWTSADSSIASVNESGVARGVAVGSTNVTASYFGLSANSAITVTATQPGTPSGTISASPNLCDIPLGGSQCTSNISWSTNNATNVSVRVYGNPNTFSSGVSGSQLAPWIQLNPDGTQRNYLFNLHHNNGAVPVLSSVTVRAQCIAGSSWNGSMSSCEATSGPTANIFAPDCLISAGQSSCMVNVSWGVSAIPAPSIRQDGVQFSTAISSVGTERTLARGINVFTVFDGTTERARDDAAATCEPGSTWNGSSCAATTGLTTNLTSNIEPQLIGTLAQSQVVYFRGGVLNSGTTNLNAPFSNNFTYCWGRGCLPADVISPHPQEASINIGSSRFDISAPFNLSNTGLLRVQHCIDSTGVISESDESPADNCKLSNFTVLTTPPAGTPKLIICPALNPVAVAVNLTVPLQAWAWDNFVGTPTCANRGSTIVTTSAIWDSSNPIIATVGNGSNKGLVAGVTVGDARITATYGGMTSNKDVQVTAESSGPYNPNITIISNPGIVRSGQTAAVVVTIEANYVLNCILSGAVSRNFMHGGPHTSFDRQGTYNYTSVPLTSARVARVTCSDPNNMTHSASTTISVIPTFQEI